MTFLEALQASLEAAAEAALTKYMSGGSKSEVEAAGRSTAIQTAAGILISSLTATTAAPTAAPAAQNLTITDATGATPKQV